MSNDSSPNLLWKPVFQYGFAGLCVLLLGIIVWLMTSLMNLQRDTIQVIDKNTSAIHEMVTYSERTEIKHDKVYERIEDRVTKIYEHILKETPKGS